MTVSIVGEGVVFQGMRGYTVSPHAPAVACFTMSVTQHLWLKKKNYRVSTFNPVVSEATRLSGLHGILIEGLLGCTERVLIIAQMSSFLAAGILEV